MPKASLVDDLCLWEGVVKAVIQKQIVITMTESEAEKFEMMLDEVINESSFPEWCRSTAEKIRSEMPE